MHILPAAGSATRFNGIPKYLLPGKVDGTAIIKMHIDEAILSGEEEILVMSSPAMEDFLKEYLYEYKSKVFVDSIISKTMTETLVKGAKKWSKSGDTITISLPDTSTDSLIQGSFHTELAKLRLEQRSLLLFPFMESYRGKLGQVELEKNNWIVKSISDKDFNCSFMHVWGAISLPFDDLVNFDEKQPTIGNCIASAIQNGIEYRGVVSNSRYFDCGNMPDYLEFLSRLLR